MATRRLRATAAPSLPVRPWFEFQIEGPAVSARAKNRRRLREWKADVAAAARAAWPAKEPPVAADVDVYISEFSDYPTQDRDNLAKPIIDAMQGIAYANDSQVARLYVEWCDINGSYRVRFMSPVVATALSIGKEFLWVRVSSHVPRRGLRG
jgi:hypothetical protein